MKNYHIFILLLAITTGLTQRTSAANYTWTGTASTAWNNASNWNPSSGFPDSTDNATIVSATNNPLLDQNRKVNNLTINSGTLDLNGFDLEVLGTGAFWAGTVTNGNFKPRGVLAHFSGTLMDCYVNAVCGYIRLSGSTFEEDAYFEDTGYANGDGAGGCVFNGNVTIKHTGSGTKFMLALNDGDVFNGDLILINESTHEIHVGRNDTTWFNGNVEVNSTNTGGITFGNNGGMSYLANSKTITVGSIGFTKDILVLKKFIQEGTTSQTLSLTDTGVVNMSDCIFNGSLTVSSPGVLIKNNTFNGSVSLTKTGMASYHSDGGNTFNGATTITNSGSSGRIRLATTTADNFIGNATFNSTGQDLQVAYSGENTFSGDITINSNKVVFNTSNGRVTFTGTNAQSINGSFNYSFKKLSFNKSSNHVTANTTLSVDDSLTFISGNLITTSTNLLTMKVASLVTGASNSSFVSGPVKKVGNTAFEFPVGKDNYLRALEITAPSNSTDAFVSEYFSSGQTNGEAMDVTIDYISLCDYWSLSRTNGSSNVNVFLNWQPGECTILDSADLRVSVWNGTKWKDLGQHSFTGTFEQGKVRNDSSISSYSNFALAYMTTPVPYVVLGSDTVVQSGNFTISNVEAYGELRWIPKADLSCYDCLNPTININYSRKYYLIADDYKKRTAVDSMIIRIPTDLTAAPQLYPPAVDWKAAEWSKYNPFTHTSQTQSQSGDEWWYGHSNSYNISVSPAEMNGYICAGYSTYINQAINEIPDGGCHDGTLDFTVAECLAFEVPGPNPSTPGLMRGQQFTTLALRKLDGKSNAWYKRFGAGEFFIAKMTSDGGYLAVGHTTSTIVPFSNPPQEIFYNFNQNSIQSNLCQGIPGNTKPVRHGYVVKVGPDGSLEWQGSYGHVDHASNPWTFMSELYNFIEIDGGFRLVGRAAAPGLSLSGNAWLLDIASDGSFVNSYLMPETSSLGGTGFDIQKQSIAQDIISYNDGTDDHLIISGIVDGSNYSNGWPSRRVFLTSIYNQNIGDLDLFTDIEWINSNSFDNNSNELNSINSFVKIGKDAQSDDIILLPVIYDCTFCYYGANNIGEGRVYLVSISDGSVLEEVSIGSVEAYDLKIDVIPTDDNGFAVLSSKAGLNDTRNWTDLTFCGGDSQSPGVPPISYWNTDAFVAKFKPSSLTPEWFIQFDIDDEQPVYYPGNYKKQECMYTITVAHDGGFVVAGNSSGNFDDYYLCKLQSDCITRNASHASIVDHVDFIYEIGDGTTPTQVEWDTDQTVLGTVIVRNNAELTIKDQALIEFADSRRIARTDGKNIITNLIVEPGGSVSVEDGASLDVITTNTSGTCNDGMWDGIQVLGNPLASQTVTNQGTCLINTGASIHNARIAIIAGSATYDSKFEYLNWDPFQSTSGGIIRANGAEFINNRENVWINPYNFQTYSVVSISGSNFECNSVLRDPFYINSDHTRAGTSTFITMVLTKHININNNTFTGHGTLGENNRGTAIRCNQCVTAIHQGNIFADLTYGIKGQYFNFGGSIAMQVYNNEFNNVQAGLNIIGGSFSSIKGNSFNIPSGTPDFKYPYGIWMQNSVGFGITDGNSFNAASNDLNYGIIVTNSDGGTGDIFGNSFDGTYVGTQAEQDNPDLMIRCNTYENHTHAWAINPVSLTGTLANQGNGCDDQDPNQRRAANQFWDVCGSNDPIHIWSSVPFTYFGPMDNNEPPDPLEDCSVIPSPGEIIYCILQVPETSCDIILPPGNQREEWLEIIGAESNFEMKQQLWQAYIRELMALDTLGQDTTIISLIDSLDERTAKWYKITWNIDRKNFEMVETLISNVTRDDAKDSAIFDYIYLLYDMAMNEGELFPFNPERINPLKELIADVALVSGRVESLLEIAGIEKYAYEPEQIPQERKTNMYPPEISTFQSEPYLLVYPNPTDGIFTLKFMNFISEGNKIVIEVFNNHGSRILYKELGNGLQPGEINLDLSGYPTGLYHGRVSGEKTTIVGKINYISQ